MVSKDLKVDVGLLLSSDGVESSMSFKSGLGTEVSVGPMKSSSRSFFLVVVEPTPKSSTLSFFLVVVESATTKFSESLLFQKSG